MLEKNHTIFTSGPRVVFIEAEKAGLVLKDEFPFLLELIALRNLTVHTYDEATAETVAHRLPSSYLIMITIAQRLEKGH